MFHELKKMWKTLKTFGERVKREEGKIKIKIKYKRFEGV